MTDETTTPSPLERAVAAAGGGPASRLLATVLERRGVVTPEAAARFLRPTLADGLRPPEQIANGTAAGAAVADAIAAGTTIAVTSTADLDAALGAVMLTESLRGFGAAIVLGEASAGLRIGLGSPEAAVLVRPADGAAIALAPDAVPPFGVGLVAWYLLLAVRQGLRQRGVPSGYDLRRGLDLVALATIAADVPLVDENRVVVRAGLQRMRETPRPIVVALREAAAIVEPTAASIARHVLPRLAGIARQGLGVLDAFVAVGSTAEARALVAAVELRRAASGHVAAAQRATCGDDVVGEVSLADVTPRFAAGLALLEPCGVGNPTPLLRARGARVDGVRLVGDPAHLRAKIRLRQDGRTVTGFLRGPEVAELLPGAILDVRFRVGIATIDGRSRIELEIVAVELPAEQSQPTDYADETVFLTVRSGPAT